MNISELEKIIEEQTGNKACCICGVPFKPRNSRQRTCGSPECKGAFHNQYLRERNKRLKAEDKEAFNRAHAIAQRKSRQKRKAVEQADRNYAKMQKHWERIAEFDKSVADYGFEYGKRQAEKTLASVPKIDVEGFMKERNKNDNLYDNDQQE